MLHRHAHRSLSLWEGIAMDTLMFGGVGMFFLILGLFLNKKHRNFVAHCIKVDGRVIGIVDKVYKSRGAFGRVVDGRTVREPIVQYRYNKLYKFQAEIDAKTHDLAHDSKLEVLINPAHPRTAKLSLTAHNNIIVFRMMMVAGLFSMIIGAITFNPNELNFDFLYDPVTVAVIIITIIFLYLKLAPVLRALPHTPIYPENAVEVENQDKI